MDAAGDRCMAITVQVVFDLRPARLTTARLYDRLDHTSYRTYDNFCPHIYIHVYMRFDLRPLRLTTGWSEPNAVVSRTLSVVQYLIVIKC